MFFFGRNSGVETPPIITQEGKAQKHLTAGPRNFGRNLQNSVKLRSFTLQKIASG
jgi:hypothetical protein